MGSWFHEPAYVYRTRFPRSLRRKAMRGDPVKDNFGCFLLMTLVATLGLSAQTAQTNGQADSWSALVASSHRMHASMGSVSKSADSNVDFVRLMPHHQTAIEMAKAQLLYGKDPQMRRRAQ